MPRDALPDDPETLKAMLLAERLQNERLRQIIKELQRHRFGRRAETLPEDQMLLGLEDVEQAEADFAAETDDASALEPRAGVNVELKEKQAPPTPRLTADFTERTAGPRERPSRLRPNRRHEWPTDV